MLKGVDIMLDFCEDGAMVLGRFEDQTQSGRAFAGSALCVIGGVKDIDDREHDALNKACEMLKKPKLSVSLGKKAELTSKCVKASRDIGYNMLQFTITVL